jgi:RND superfamily putative drug exporter
VRGRSSLSAIIASIMLAAVLSITVLPAILGVLGPSVDALGVRTLLRIPFVRNTQRLNQVTMWLVEMTQRTKTRSEVENGFWGRLVTRVMKRPLAYAIPIIIGMVLLMLPLGPFFVAVTY